MGWIWWVDYSAISAARPPPVRLPCAPRARLEYSGDPDAVVGSWILLEKSTAEQVDEVGAAARWALVEREGYAPSM